ncbi:Dynein assembly factor 4, axonemal [Gonapodya sp. JEL0774]|nr:Dynein assembly factor 4, axonemal [Gonapodya sp. JEL0774]
MPIQVKDFQFSESEEEASIVVNLKGVASSKVDIYSDDSYIKINYPPYFFELDLYDHIDDAASRATIAGGVVSFHLVKVRSCVWTSARSALPIEELKERRLAAQARLRVRHEAEAKERQAKKHEQERAMVERQLKVEQAQRAEVEEAKRREKSEAADSLQNWLEASAAPAPAEPANDLELTEEELAEVQSRVRKQLELKWQDYVRRQNNSTAEKKEDSAGLHEETPSLLITRANHFLSTSDFSSALAALSAAVSLSPHDPTLLANRAALHLRMEDHNAAVADCERAMEEIGEAVARAAVEEGVPESSVEEGAKKLKAKIWARWGAAEAGRGNTLEGVKLLEKALMLNPGSQELQTDVDMLRSRLEQGDSEQGYTLAKRKEKAAYPFSKETYKVNTML